MRLKASHHLFDRLTVGGNFSYVDGRGKFMQKGSNVVGPDARRDAHDAELQQLPTISTPTTQTQRSYRYPQPVLFDNTAGRGYDNPFFVIFQDPNTGETNRAYGNLNMNLRCDGLAEDRIHPGCGLLQQPAARRAGAVVLELLRG